MKIAFLDKDGTLVKPKSGNTFVQHPEDQVLIEGVSERIQELVEAGYTLVVVSNQAGVEHGFKSLQDAFDEMRYLMRLLPQIEVCYFCPDMEGVNCWKVTKDNSSVNREYKFYYRKPYDGMLRQSSKDFDDFLAYTPENRLLIGDMESDKQCAEKAGIRYLDVNNWLASGIIMG